MAVNSSPRIYKEAGDAERQLQWKINNDVRRAKLVRAAGGASQRHSPVGAVCIRLPLPGSQQRFGLQEAALPPLLSKNSEQCMELKHQTEMESLLFFPFSFLFFSFCSNI